MIILWHEHALLFRLRLWNSLSQRRGESVPNTDLQHATEQLWVVGDDPANVDDELLLQHGLSLAVGAALAVYDVFNDPWRQGVRDHDLLMPKQAESHLVKQNLRQSASCCIISQRGIFACFFFSEWVLMYSNQDPLLYKFFINKSTLISWEHFYRFIRGWFCTNLFNAIWEMCYFLERT